MSISAAYLRISGRFRILRKYIIYMRAMVYTSETMFCPNCGEKIPEGGRFCPSCGYSTSGGPLTPGNGDSNHSSSTNTKILMNKKSEGLALILSFMITGLGHIYLNQTSRGIGLLVATVACWALTFVLLFPFVIAFALWIYGMYDSYKLAQLYNEYLFVHDGQPPW